MTTPEHSVSLAEAKAHLSALLNRVEAGESFHITKRGRRIATVSPSARSKAPVDLGWLQSITASMVPQDVDAGDFLRAERDGARY